MPKNFLSQELFILGGSALECMVGLNNETKPMECSGSWDQVLQLLLLQLLLLLLLLGNVVVPALDQLGSGWVGHANNCNRIQTPFPYSIINRFRRT